MLKEIIFLPEVPDNEKTAVLDFLKLWQNDKQVISIYTSGSTGKPQKINVRKQAMVASAKATGAFFELTQNHTSLLNLSANYIAGMMQIVRADIFDMQLIVAPVCSNPLKYIDGYSVNFAAFVPLQVKTILDNKNTQTIYESINHVIIGGAPIADNLLRDITALPNNSYATFGMTETVSHIALKALEAGNTVYQALPNVSFAQNSDGCLLINAPHITKAALVTNDRVELLSKTKFKWVGRADFVINSGGVKVQPEEVEAKLSDNISDQFYIHKAKDKLLGERVVIYIESEPYSTKGLAELETVFKRLLNRYEIPKTILFRKAFKRTATGKIIRQ